MENVMCGATQYPNVQRPLGSSLESSQATSVNPEFAKVPEISPVIQDFSIVVGGPVYDLLLRSGLVRVGLENVLRRIVALVGITWVPLLLFSLAEGHVTGHRVTIPLLSDFATYGRFLLALPLFLLAELVIDPATRSAVKSLVDIRIVQQKEFPEFEDVLLKLQRLRDSWIPEVGLLILAFLPVFLFRKEWTNGTVSSWHTTAQGLTTAGWWYATISAPVLRFIAYRWIFRYFIWALLLWRIGQLNLHLMPTHPDRAAGLDFLSRTQRRFGILLCALSCTFSGHLVNGLLHEGVSFASYKFLIAGFLAFAVVLGTLPLTLLAPTLSRVRRTGLHEYGRLGNQYAEAFDRKWVHMDTPPSEPLLGTRDTQSLAGFVNSYDVIRQMQIVPITKRLVVELVVQASIPLVPVIILGIPTGELVSTVVKMLAR
jgi:hypothetical protein